MNTLAIQPWGGLVRPLEDEDDAGFSEMEWATLEYPKRRVNAAGARLVDSDYPLDMGTALDITSNWRACHNFPLNTFQVCLQERAKRIYSGALVAQRIKRLSSI